MTDQELTTIVSSVLSALSTNTMAINALTPISTLHDGDLFEVSGGRRISFGAIKDIIATDVLPGADFVRVISAENAAEAYEAATAPEIVDDGHITIISWRGGTGKSGVILQTHLGANLVTQMAPIEGDTGRATKIRAIQLSHDEDGTLTNVSVGQWLTTKTISNLRLTDSGVIEYQNAATGYWLTFVDLSPLKIIADAAKTTAETAASVANSAISTANAAATTASNAMGVANEAKTAANNAQEDATKALAQAFGVVRFDGIVSPPPTWNVVTEASGIVSNNENAHGVYFDLDNNRLWLRSVTSNTSYVYLHWADAAEFGQMVSGGWGTSQTTFKPFEHRIYSTGAKLYVYDGSQMILFADMTDSSFHQSALDDAAVKTFQDLWTAMGGTMDSYGRYVDESGNALGTSKTASYPLAVQYFVDKITSDAGGSAAAAMTAALQAQQTATSAGATANAANAAAQTAQTAASAAQAAADQVSENLETNLEIVSGRISELETNPATAIKFAGVKTPKSSLQSDSAPSGVNLRYAVYLNPSSQRFYVEVKQYTLGTDDPWQLLGCYKAWPDVALGVKPMVYYGSGASYVEPYNDRVYIDEAGHLFAYNGSILVPTFPLTSSIGNGVTIGNNVTLPNGFNGSALLADANASEFFQLDEVVFDLSQTAQDNCPVPRLVGVVEENNATPNIVEVYVVGASTKVKLENFQGWSSFEGGEFTALASKPQRLEYYDDAWRLNCALPWKVTTDVVSGNSVRVDSAIYTPYWHGMVNELPGAVYGLRCVLVKLLNAEDVYEAISQYSLNHGNVTSSQVTQAARQTFDDLWATAGGTRNVAAAESKQYVLNGVEMNYAQARAVYYWSPKLLQWINTGKTGDVWVGDSVVIPTNFPLLQRLAYEVDINILPLLRCNIKKLRIQTNTLSDINVIGNASYGTVFFEEIVDKMRIVQGSLYGWLRYCSQLKTADFRIKNTAAMTLNLERSNLLTLETMQSMVSNAANTAPITITVHADVYAKLTNSANTDWYAVMTAAVNKNISFAKP